MKSYGIFFLILVLFLAACSSGAQSGNPAWVDKLIKQFEKNPVGNPPLSIWKYDYNGQTVYFVPAHCCDIPSVVYDASGSQFCSPDGGITGQGDGKCPNFFTERTNEQLIWQDARTH